MEAISHAKQTGDANLETKTWQHLGNMMRYYPHSPKTLKQLSNALARITPGWDEQLQEKSKSSSDKIQLSKKIYNRRHVFDVITDTVAQLKAPKQNNVPDKANVQTLSTSEISALPTRKDAYHHIDNLTTDLGSFDWLIDCVAKGAFIQDDLASIAHKLNVILAKTFNINPIANNTDLQSRNNFNDYLQRTHHTIDGVFVLKNASAYYQSQGYRDINATMNHKGELAFTMVNAKDEHHIATFSVSEVKDFALNYSEKGVPISKVDFSKTYEALDLNRKQSFSAQTIGNSR